MSNHAKFVFGILALAFIAVAIERKMNAPAKPVQKVAEKRIDSVMNAVEKYIRENPYVDVEDRVNALSITLHSPTKEGILLTVEEIETLRTRISHALADTAYAERAKKWRATLIKKQVECLPDLRRVYVGVTKKAAWENDVDVSISGTNYTTITFTGGVFAANKNKQDLHLSIYDVLLSLRFRRACYRWYSGDDGTCYILEPPADSVF